MLAAPPLEVSDERPAVLKPLSRPTAVLQRRSLTGARARSFASNGATIHEIAQGLGVFELGPSIAAPRLRARF